MVVKYLLSLISSHALFAMVPTGHWVIHYVEVPCDRPMVNVTQGTAALWFMHMRTTAHSTDQGFGILNEIDRVTFYCVLIWDLRYTICDGSPTGN